MATHHITSGHVNTMMYEQRPVMLVRTVRIVSLFNSGQGYFYTVDVKVSPQLFFTQKRAIDQH